MSSLRRPRPGRSALSLRRRVNRRRRGAAHLGAEETLQSRMRSIGLQTPTDKIVTHGYDDVYGWMLQPFAKRDPLAILEVGYGVGGGVSFWRRLFPQSYFYCLDLDLNDQLLPNVSLLKADQSSVESLRSALAKVKHKVEIIIDDGSHCPRHQTLTFSILFRDVLQPGGLYIIEDIETSYWRRGTLYGAEMNYGIANPLSAIEAFKHLADCVNAHFLDPADCNSLHLRLLDTGIDPDAVDSVASVSFARNAIMIRKSDATNPHAGEPPYGGLLLTKRC